MNDLEYLKKYYDGNIDDALNRLKAGEPVQYIVGNVDFYGININVNKNVLIPRFETELLVSKTIDYITNCFLKPVSILDIGTGSGCISLALKSKIKESSLTAADISDAALEVAKENAIKNDLDISFIESDIFSNVTGKFDVIISNPPYIASSDEIDLIVLNNEPHLALFAKDDGLFFYNTILKDARKYLNEAFIIALEIGNKEGSAVLKIAKEYFSDSKITLERDLTDKDRYVFIIKE